MPRGLVLSAFLILFSDLRLSNCQSISVDRPLYRETIIPVISNIFGTRILASPPAVMHLHIREIIQCPLALQELIPPQRYQETILHRQVLRETIHCLPARQDTIRSLRVLQITIVRRLVPQEHHRVLMALPHTTPHLVILNGAELLTAIPPPTDVPTAILAMVPKVCCRLYARESTLI
ncbi:hypothetical protein BKA82DRAFT_2496459 [Pisolithus tinctorius]|nr:hypothetical protein BKA82DRAFT_2496459 [Pisolithus tinctorius]